MQQADPRGEFLPAGAGLSRLIVTGQGTQTLWTYVGCVCMGTDGAGRGDTFLLILRRNYKLRCDYRTVKKELPQRNFQMVMQNN